MTDETANDPDVTVAILTPSIGRLAAALAKFQGAMPSVPKDKTATVPTKSGGSYSYKYADLADVTAAATPILAKNELAFICIPEEGNRGFILRGLLVHSSGEQIEGFLPLYGGTNQELGSSLTYGRRYLLGALTGIVTDVDDDGATAKESGRTEKSPARPRQTRQAAAEQAPPQAGPPPVADDAWTDKIADAATIGDLTAVYTEADHLGILEHTLNGETVKARLYARRNELSAKDAQ